MPEYLRTITTSSPPAQYGAAREPDGLLHRHLRRRNSLSAIRSSGCQQGARLGPWTSKPTGPVSNRPRPGLAIAITSIGTGTARIALI
jgi:hypothetical protein